MREEVITLTQKEHERLSVIPKVMKRELRQKDAAGSWPAKRLMRPIHRVSDGLT